MRLLNLTWSQWRLLPFCLGIACLVLTTSAAQAETPESSIASTSKAGAPNIVFVLCDDHRFDCLSVEGHPFLKTPQLDQLAADGVRCTRAYVTTSLCSPSRASILTGQYAHHHRVVDNYHPVDPNLVFFPQVLQSKGYQTAFFGKWHMGGDVDDKQRGFDHWVAFKGQGTYFPDGHGTTREVPQTTYDGLNVNGKRVPQKGYITDELTDYAIDWLDSRSTDEPFFMYVSHKAVHADFVPADRHRGTYDGQPLPIKVPTVAEMDQGNLPMWVRNQRNSRHGADFGYNLKDFSSEVYYRRYCESLLAVDESVGRLRSYLRDQALEQNTLFVYMGDNGFQFGDHGLIDKRVAYEASARVPLIMSAPGRLPKGATFDGVIGNIDVAPTILSAANSGVASSEAASSRESGADEKAEKSNQVELKPDGNSLWKPLTTGDGSSVRDRTLLYEYYWERNYPHTPTIHAVLGSRFKYIRCHGLWDRDELYDLKNDPQEMNNLINDPNFQDRKQKMNDQLWELLDRTDGHEIPLLEDRGPLFPARDPSKAPQAKFPSEYFID